MGNSIKSALFSIAETAGWKNKDVRCLIIGLDAAGKTSILYKMKLGEVVTTIPTIGFNVETISYKNVNLTAWDVGGRDKIRPLYRHYFANTQALIYVIDSNDRERINEARDELRRMLDEDELRDVVLLVLANKQDLEKAMSVDEVSKAIDFESMKPKTKFIIGTCAIKGDGLFEAFDWLAQAINGTIITNTTNKPAENELVVATKETIHDTKMWTTKLLSILKLQWT